MANAKSILGKIMGNRRMTGNFFNTDFSSKNYSEEYEERKKINQDNDKYDKEEQYNERYRHVHNKPVQFVRGKYNKK